MKIVQDEKYLYVIAPKTFPVENRECYVTLLDEEIHEKIRNFVNLFRTRFEEFKTTPETYDREKIISFLKEMMPNVTDHNIFHCLKALGH